MRKTILVIACIFAFVINVKADVFQKSGNVQVIAMNKYNENSMQPSDNNPYFFVNSHYQKTSRKTSYTGKKYSYYKTNYTSNNYSYLFKEIGSKYNLDPKLLYAIAVTESSLNPNAINYNTNGSIDYGLMQINSCHLPTLSKFGIDKNSLFQPQTNITVGAWILSKCVNKYGYSWNAIACYHMGSGSLDNREALRYVWQVYENLKG